MMLYGIQSTGVRPHFIDTAEEHGPRVTYCFTVCGQIVRQRGDNVLEPDEMALLLPLGGVCGICRIKAS